MPTGKVFVPLKFSNSAFYTKNQLIIFEVEVVSFMDKPRAPHTLTLKSLLIHYPTVTPNLKRQDID